MPVSSPRGGKTSVDHLASDGWAEPVRSALLAFAELLQNVPAILDWFNSSLRCPHWAFSQPIELSFPILWGIHASPTPAWFPVCEATLNDKYIVLHSFDHRVCISFFYCHLSFIYFLFSLLSLDVLSVFGTFPHVLVQEFSWFRWSLHYVFQMRPVLFF